MDDNKLSIPAYPPPDKWGPLFEADSTPSPIFISLMSSIFDKLDRGNTGYLTPEIYSDFLEAQGYPLPANTWKNALEQANGDNRKDVADLELGLYFSERGISHKLAPRPRAQPEEFILEASTDTEAKLKESIKFAENMPLLSRQGFVDLAGFEYLQDPATAHQYLRNAVQEMGIFTNLGDIPRDILPSSPHVSTFPLLRADTGVVDVPDMIAVEDDLEALEMTSAFSDTTPSERREAVAGEASSDDDDDDDEGERGVHDDDDVHSAVSNKRIPGGFIHKVGNSPLRPNREEGDEIEEQLLDPSIPISTVERRERAGTLLKAYEQARGDIPWVEEKGKAALDAENAGAPGKVAGDWI